MAVIDQARELQKETGIVLTKALMEFRMYFNLTDQSSIVKSRTNDPYDLYTNGDSIHIGDKGSFVSTKVDSNYNVKGTQAKSMIKDGPRADFSMEFKKESPSAPIYNKSLYAMIKEASSVLTTKVGAKKISYVNDFALSEYKSDSQAKALKPFFDELDNNLDITTLSELFTTLKSRHTKENLLDDHRNQHLKSILALGGNKNRFLAHSVSMLGINLKDPMHAIIVDRKRIINHIMGQEGLISSLLSSHPDDYISNSALTTAATAKCE